MVGPARDAGRINPGLLAVGFYFVEGVLDMFNPLLSGGLLAAMANPNGTAGAAGALLGLVIILFIVVLVLGSMIVWIWSLVDLLRSPTSSDTKLLWVLVIFFLGIVGSMLYIFIQRPKNAPNN